MADKKQQSRQKRSEKRRNDAGLTQVKVYLDQTTLKLLELLQKDMSDGDIKYNERNMFRSMAVTASIHRLAKERLNEHLVSRVMEEHMGTDCNPDEAIGKPHKFLLRAMINHIYRNGTRPQHRRRLAEVAETMNESSFRNPRATNRGWNENDISRYVSNDIMLEK